MLDRINIMNKLTEINNQIAVFERYLKYAKDSDTIVSLCDDILALRFKRDIYLRLL